MGTGTTIAIVLGGVAVAGGVTYLIVRKPGAAASLGRANSNMVMGSAAAMMGPQVMAARPSPGRATGGGGGGVSPQQMFNLGTTVLDKIYPGAGGAIRTGQALAGQITNLTGKIPVLGSAQKAVTGAAKKVLNKLKFW